MSPTANPDVVLPTSRRLGDCSCPRIAARFVYTFLSNPNAYSCHREVSSSPLMSNQSKNVSPLAASAYAPGRVELLGNHTDYNEGVVLGAAIDRGLTVRGRKRDDGMISIESSTMGHVEIARSALRPLEENRWANYALGVANELIALSIPVEGFSAEVSGDLAAGCGLSSSAAFELATALFLLKLYGRNLGSLEIAKACQRAEHRFAGVRSGLLDQVTSLFGRADHLVFFDCRSEEVRAIPFPQGLALIIAESGKKRELTKGEYNARRRETRAAADALQVSALRDVTSDALTSRRGLPDLFGVALHTSWRKRARFARLGITCCRRWAGIRWVDERVTRKFA